MPPFQGVHVEVANIVLAWYKLIRVHKANRVKLTIAACADVDHVVEVTLNMVMDIATKLHVRIARLFRCCILWHAGSTPATRE
jgi:hypothetical protein